MEVTSELYPILCLYQGILIVSILVFMEVTSEPFFSGICWEDKSFEFQSLFSWKLHQSKGNDGYFRANRKSFNPCFHGSYIRARNRTRIINSKGILFQSLFSWKLHQSISMLKKDTGARTMFQSLFSWKLHQSYRLCMENLSK